MEAERRAPLPRLSGNVLIRSFEYKRPVTMTAELQSLGRRGKRTSFEEYDPADDVVELDITVRAARALQIKNDLVETDLDLGSEGLLLTGTNGRYGMRGTVDIKPGGRITLRRNVFEISHGHGALRRSDAHRAESRRDCGDDYRRYAASSAASSGASSSSGAAASAGSTTSTGRPLDDPHARPRRADLKVDLTSDPALAQDDIFLLLTVGLTRAELDQAQSASVGESVALEALGNVEWRDRAVTDAVPVIDEFRFGSAYSSRTGRTEPTVTIGKRLTERVRANGDDRPGRVARGALERRVAPEQPRQRGELVRQRERHLELGARATRADVRWRLEFEQKAGAHAPSPTRPVVVRLGRTDRV